MCRTIKAGDKQGKFPKIYDKKYKNVLKSNKKEQNRGGKSGNFGIMKIIDASIKKTNNINAE